MLHAAYIELLETRRAELAAQRNELFAADKINTPECKKSALHDRLLCDLLLMEGGTLEQQDEVIRRLKELE